VDTVFREKLLPVEKIVRVNAVFGAFLLKLKKK